MIKAALIFIWVFIKWTVINFVMAIPHALKGAWHAATRRSIHKFQGSNDKPKFIESRPYHNKRQSGYGRDRGYHHGNRNHDYHHSRW